MLSSIRAPLCQRGAFRTAVSSSMNEGSQFAGPLLQIEGEVLRPDHQACEFEQVVELRDGLLDDAPRQRVIGREFRNVVGRPPAIALDVGAIEVADWLRQWINPRCPKNSSVQSAAASHIITDPSAKDSSMGPSLALTSPWNT